MEVKVITKVIEVPHLLDAGVFGFPIKYPLHQGEENGGLILFEIRAAMPRSPIRHFGWALWIPPLGKGNDFSDNMKILMTDIGSVAIRPSKIVGGRYFILPATSPTLFQLAANLLDCNNVNIRRFIQKKCSIPVQNRRERLTS